MIPIKAIIELQKEVPADPANPEHAGLADGDMIIEPYHVEGIVLGVMPLTIADTTIIDDTITRDSVKRQVPVSYDVAYWNVLVHDRKDGRWSLMSIREQAITFDDKEVRDYFRTLHNGR